MPKPHVCLNMIVRNESARIIRALDSCKDHISSYAILDTGSTDATEALIKEWGAKNNIKGIVGKGAFIDFSQARNAALTLAKSWHSKPSTPWFDFLLLMDADMELRVTHDSAFENLTGDTYTAVQKAGGMSYTNVRLVSAATDGKYVGVTHEHFDKPPAGDLGNLHFIDHADGANRPDKFERDIRLLLADLETNPLNPRSWFYLANSYRDAKRFTEATDAYRKRVELGGWDEEVWHAQMDLAVMLKEQGLDDAFLKEALKAYQLRPQRAEVLHLIGKHLREKDQARAALLFVEKGIDQRRPDDLLFVQDWVYVWGMREEYSICGFYGDKDQKDRGYRITNSLAMDPDVPEHNRNLARSNMTWYLPRLDALCSAFETHEIDFLPSRGYTAMNPSVCQRPNGGLEVLLRTVNYKMDNEGRYMIGEKGCNDAPIITENWLLNVGDDLVTKDWARVSWDRPKPKFDMVIGLEDMRLYWYRGVRRFSATVREQSETGQCEMWAGDLERHFGHTEVAHAMRTHRISDGTTTQKNWMPVPGGVDERWMYDVKTVIEPAFDRKTVIDYAPAVENIRGSSQLIPFKSGYLAVTHEAVYRGGKRVYQHRFLYFTKDLYPQRFSLPFVFEDVQIEFCAGLAQHPDMNRLVISYGVRDEKAMLATVPIEQVAMMLGQRT